MRINNLIVVGLVFLLVVGGFVFSNVFSNNEISSGSNLITGFATLDPDLVVGDSGACIAYDSTDCPEDYGFLFSVNNQFLNWPGGDHIADYGIFPYALCCPGFVSNEESPNKVLIYQKELPGGAHAFDYDLLAVIVNDTPERRDEFNVFKADNSIIVSEANQSCPDEYGCMFKVSALRPKDYLFDNSHIWTCNITMANLKSICYVDLSDSFCTAEAAPCDAEHFGQIDPATGWYCGGDENEELVNGQGRCCSPGKYYDVFLQTCTDASPCGFELGETDCPLGYADNGFPNNYFEEEYFFNVPGCVNWAQMESCCFNITKYGRVGHYNCPILTLPLD
jgi:hypothetical protein